jgi:hypothetical protein
MPVAALVVTSSNIPEVRASEEHSPQRTWRLVHEVVDLCGNRYIERRVDNASLRKSEGMRPLARPRRSISVLFPKAFIRTACQVIR